MYRPGDLRLVDPPCEDGYEECEEEGRRCTVCDGIGEGHVHSLHDYSFRRRGEDRWFPPCAYLPHSCDEWVIGGPDEVRVMIDDLQAALAVMGHDYEPVVPEPIQPI